MPKLYSFLSNVPESFPRPNMTIRDMRDFVRDHPNRLAFEEVILKGVHRGKVVRITERTLPTLQARYPVLCGMTWQALVAARLAMAERKIFEGRGDTIINQHPA
ncbi:hypothetical protein AV944_06615 [Sphingomonas sp. LK11]|uniref:hypothetical protein n=1 Tax=Sphingomonas sp. LK11 TaxID=1390395 RepID=UPI0009727F5C|nr:hypothetical protein [Sphingomonas sp. LK11]APX65569.1 hypothetical protein AV944_06615 [Sphingomonas sp. LK11]